VPEHIDLATLIKKWTGSEADFIKNFARNSKILRNELRNFFNS
jgi:hypothetical protein